MLSPMLRTNCFIAAVLLATSNSNTLVDAKTARLTSRQFMNAMNGNKKQNSHLRPSNKNRKASLYKNLLAKAKFVEGRKLDESSGSEDEYGFDVSQYSVKYNGCATIKTYSDEVAEEEESDTVLESKRFVTFRLCPSSSCNKYSVEGCSSNYGEYILSMDEYLEELNEYTTEFNEQYCEFCAECVYNEELYQSNNGDGNDDQQQGDDEGAEEAEDEAEDAEDEAEDAEDEAEDAEDEAEDAEDEAEDADGDERKLDEEAEDEGAEDEEAEDEEAEDEEAEDEEAEDEEAEDEESEESEEEAAEGCSLYDQCSGYTDVCSSDGNGDDDNNNDSEEQDDEQFDIQEFFDCTAVDVGDDDNAVVYYVGPQCESDGTTISFGVYSDQYCSTYVGDKVSLDDVLGFSIESDEIAFLFPKDCVACTNDAAFWEEESEDDEDDDGNGNDNRDNINQLCEGLYESSAKCNSKFTEFNSDADYTQQQIDNDETVCDFIDVVKSGQYNEDGELSIISSSGSGLTFNMSDWKGSLQQDIKYLEAEVSKVSAGRILFLLLSILGCSFLAVWSCLIQSQLSGKSIGWRPRRGKLTGATDVSRQSSGIMFGRSQSIGLALGDRSAAKMEPLI